MSAEIPGLFEVPLRDAVEGLSNHALCQGIPVTPKKVKEILISAIDAGDLVPVSLVRNANRRIDEYETFLNERDLIDHRWLVSVGLHGPGEIGSNDFPTFKRTRCDDAIAEWLAYSIDDIRAAVFHYATTFPDRLVIDVRTALVTFLQVPDEDRERLLAAAREPAQKLETPDERAERVLQEVEAERRHRNPKPTKTVADRHELTPARIKQLMKRAKDQRAGKALAD